MFEELRPDAELMDEDIIMISVGELREVFIELDALRRRLDSGTAVA